MLGTYENVSCTAYPGACKFNFTCADFLSAGDYGHQFEISLNDIYQNQQQVSFTSIQLLEDGAKFGDPGTCYVPIMQNLNGNQDVIVLGQILFNYNYVAFDATPTQEDGLFTNAVYYG